MTKITSEGNRKTIWFSIIFSTLFFGAMGTFIIYSFVKMYIANQVETKTFVMPIFGLIVYFIAYSFVKSYLKNSSKIEIDKEKIIIQNKTYYWKNLQNIKLSGKKGFGFFKFQMEAITINFENKTEYIFEDLYSNSWEIKSFIQQIIIDKKDFFETNSKTINTKITDKEIEKETFYQYKGNPVFSFRGLMMWGLIGAFLFMFIFVKAKISLEDQLQAFIPITVIWFIINALFMNYFEMSKNYFVIKNHYFFWVKRIYKISDIEEIVFESQGKQPNSLKLVTKDFKRKLYPAGTLRDSKWLELKSEFEKRNINVRNECI